MIDLTELNRVLRRLVGDTVGIGVGDPRYPTQPLWPEEEVAAERMTRKRRNEFTVGREAARAAMIDLGLQPAAISMGPDRAPIWPAGLTGSISHCNHAAVALVANINRNLSIGVDIEETTPLDPTIWETVLTSEELRWLAAQPKNSRGDIAKQMFSAKEAVYKAQYPLTETFLSFQDVSLAQNRQGFVATARGPEIRLKPQQVFCEVFETLVVSIVACPIRQGVSALAQIQSIMEGGTDGAPRLVKNN
ncbi:4'-phosphopantetheinyl transferase superfamily protein [Ruegeria sp. ANG-R]|uniref:4'-phosphopantetheinyl transferase family protein n=1 Tax=Ruegeria sp. ANG-R TaxID=1577903 RepID=UPI00068F5A15|nr:4'-phosphopantetheinyl transferase superfamily protein [Ruegeria sp. ANG-R]